MMKTKIQIPLMLKSSSILLSCLLVAGQSGGQTLLSPGEARHYAALTRQDPQSLEKLPLQIQADLSGPIGLTEGDYGGLLIPDARLRLKAVQEAQAAPTPVAELWFHHLAPMKDGWAVSEADLYLVEVTNDGERIKVPCCPVGIRKGDQGGLELLVYGKGKQPLLVLPMRAVNRPGAAPVEFLAERDRDDAGQITIRLFGKYEGQFRVTELIPW